MVISHLHGKHWVKPELDWKREELDTVLEVSFDLKRKFARGEPHKLLDGKTLFMMFYAASTRTRNSFEAGMTQLGGHAHFISTEGSWIGVEDVRDTAAVLSRYGHGIGVRYCPAGVEYGEAHKIIEAYSKNSIVPVINMEDDTFHPCQGMADLMTVKEKLRKFEGKKFVMSWAYNPRRPPVAVATTNILFMTRFGMDVTLAHPPDFDLEPKMIEQAKKNAEENGSEFTITNDMKEAFEGADVVYPKNWGSWKHLRADNLKGELESQHRDKFKDWICDQEKIDLCKKSVIYMHCMPAKRGNEVTDEVIDGPHSVTLDQAENRLHAQKGIMALTMGGLP
jgi:ornithine carbamoyltransferase